MTVVGRILGPDLGELVGLLVEGCRSSFLISSIFSMGSEAGSSGREERRCEGLSPGRTDQEGWAC